MQDKRTMMQKARDAWGAAMPDWVMALAVTCDKGGLRKTAKKLEASPATVSIAIHKRRGYEFDFIKNKVEAVLMAGIIPCPLRNTIMTKDECEAEQRRLAVPSNWFNTYEETTCRECKYRSMA